MSKFCSKCNSELNDDAKFCPNCGASLNVPVELNELGSNSAVPVQPSAPVFQTTPEVAFTPVQPEPAVSPIQPDVAVNPIQPDGFTNQTQPGVASFQPYQQGIPAYQPVDSVYSNQETPRTPSKALSIISMITGILSLLCCCCGALGLILGIASVTLGIISLATKKGGKGMAITGIICGGLGFLGGLVTYIAIWGAYAGDYAFGDFEDIIEDFVDSLGMGGIF